MSIELSIEFAGICLYVIPPQQGTVSVLIPTCVPTPNGRVKTEHEDKTIGARHVPYLLANLMNSARAYRLASSAMARNSESYGDSAARNSSSNPKGQRATSSTRTPYPCPI